MYLSYAYLNILPRKFLYKFSQVIFLLLCHFVWSYSILNKIILKDYSLYIPMQKFEPFKINTTWGCFNTSLGFSYLILQRMIFEDVLIPM